MNVGKIFKVLIIVVACVIIGALVLNVLLPNTTKSLVNAVEQQIFNATGLSFDFNGDGSTVNGDGGRDHTGESQASQLDAGQDEKDSAEVSGW